MKFDKDIDNRLAAIEGHVKGIRQMLKDEKECDDIILQVYAVEKSINKVARIMIKSHLNVCVKESIEKGEYDILDKFNSVLEKYIGGV